MPFDTTILFLQLKSKCEEYGIPLTRDVLLASIRHQRMAYLRDGNVVCDFPISTSRAAPSCVKDSLGTPDGLFSVIEKIGEGVPAGTVFVARCPTGIHFSEWLKNKPDCNLITSRILRLTGEEAGHNRGGNVDTFERYVYIHGTNQEAKLGTPNSHGCLLMANDAIIKLFGQIAVPARLLIV
ncbi:MAG: L,D-transpeptidase [Opitutales bacterium]|nr:L,D-transpeptidase [Opitutales bacterium]